jgi:hypothetical protein
MLLDQSKLTRIDSFDEILNLAKDQKIHWPSFSDEILIFDKIQKSKLYFKRTKDTLGAIIGLEKFTNYPLYSNPVSNDDVDITMFKVSEV